MSPALPVLASVIAEHLGLALIGDDVSVSRAVPLKSAVAGSLVFAKRATDDDIAFLKSVPGVVVIAAPEIGNRLTMSRIISPKPRLTFAKALAHFFAERPVPGVAPSAVLGTGVVIGDGTHIGAGAVIGDYVSIGARTVVHPNVVIAPRVTIGDDCMIKSGTVIGQEGFGFDFEDDGTPFRVPHIGTVRIGNRVELGALNTVASATTGTTEIHDDVKTDDHVHIAHNCIVGRGCILTAAAELSGSVTLGTGVWVGPNSSITNGISIGNRALVGIAAVVTKPVPDGMVVIGNPARVLRERRPGE